MTETKKPSKGVSGEHPIVLEFRKKMDSIQDHTIPEVQELAERIERLKEKSDRPPADPRREEGDEEIHDDVVDLPEGPP